MSWTCGSCGHNQLGPGKCAKCHDTNMVDDDAQMDPWLLAKTRGDVATIIWRAPGVWWVLDAYNKALDKKTTLQQAEYVCREKGMAFEVKGHEPVQPPPELPLL
jgi:hypothetical protein